MNPRLQQLALEHGYLRWDEDSQSYELDGGVDAMYAFAELVVGECLTIAKNREDELERAGLLAESNTVGVVSYRIARQFGVDE